MSAESMRLLPRKVSPSEAAFCFFTESSGAAFADDETALGATPPPVAPGAVAFHVSAGVAVLISAIAAHDRCTVGVLVGRLAAERAREIGCGFLARAALDHDSVSRDAPDAARPVAPAGRPNVADARSGLRALPEDEGGP